MQLIELKEDYKPGYKSKIPEDIKNKIYTMFKQLNVVTYPTSDHRIVNVKLAKKKIEILYPKMMYVQFNEINDGCILRVSSAKLSTNNEIILGAFREPMYFRFKVVL